MIHAVLFDFDGTLTRPGALDFAVIRTGIGCPQGIPILEYIESLHDLSARERASAILDEFELAAARASTPNEGAEEVLAGLAARGVPFGILTRNSRIAVRTALESFSTVREGDFPVIICREDDARPKPHPDGVLLAASRFGCPPERLLVVGDYRFDVEAGAAAGALTALLTNEAAFRPSVASAAPRPPWHGTPRAGAPAPVSSDYLIHGLAEVLGIVDRLRAGPPAGARGRP